MDPNSKVSDRDAQGGVCRGDQCGSRELWRPHATGRGIYSESPLGFLGMEGCDRVAHGRHASRADV
jgi:hypothetical protein